MSFEAMRRCRPLQVSPAQKSVLMCIADRANDDGEAWPSIPGICEWTCLGRTAVIEALKRLEEAGIVNITKVPGKNNRCALCFERIDVPAHAAADSTESADQSAIQTGPPAEPVREPDYTRPAGGPPPVREPDYSRPAGGPEASISIIQATESISSSAKVDDCPHQEIVAAYRAEVPFAVQPREWTPERQALLRARWREDTERQSVDWWRNFFAWIAKSKFLTGQAHRSGGRPSFRLSLDWLLTLRNFIKVSEGRYHDGVRQPMDDSRPAWAVSAGFANRFEAENAGCYEHNAMSFAEGRRLEAA